MSIASRITSMENNIRNAYHGLDSIGIDTTNTNKNIENISALLDDFYDSLPKVSGSGSNISLSPTLKGRITSQINGDTFQQTYTGKNLLEDTLLTTTTEKNGITATPVYDEKGLLQYINFNGTSTANTYINISRIDFGTTNFNSDTGGSTEYIATAGNQNIRLTYDASNRYTYVYFANNRVVNNEKVYPMIRLASVSDSNYEPYVGGTASPNPDYPQNIECVTGLQKISNVGKNLFDGIFELGGYTISNGNKGSANDRIRTPGFIKVKANQEYTLSFENTGSVYVLEYDKNKTYLNKYTRVIYHALSGNFTTSADTEYITFYYIPYQHDLTLNEKCQLEKGSTVTTYEAFSGETYNINLGDIELNKIGDYKDYITGSPNNWSIVKAIGKVTLNGTETWGTTTTSTTGKYRNSIDFSDLVDGNYIKPSSNNEVGLILSKYYISIIANTAGTYGCHQGMSLNNSSSLYIYDDTYNTNDTTAFKNWLSTHNLEINYVLATPTTTPITNQELITQLNNWYYAMSKNGETNISVDGNLPIILDVSALKDTE